MMIDHKGNTFKNISGIIVQVISSLTIIFDILLFFPTLRIKKSIPNWTFLLCQFLICSLIAAIYFILNEIQRKNKTFDCLIILITRNYCSLIIISSSLCICLSNLFVLTNNYFVKQKLILMKIIFILITWFPSLIILSIIFIGNFQNNIDPNKNDCVIENSSFAIIYFSVIGSYYVAIFVTCGFIINKLLKIKKLIQNNLVKKSIKAINSYIIGIFLFFIFDITCDILRTVQSGLRAVFIIFLCCMNPVMTYLFVLTNQVKKSCRNVYCNCCSDNLRTYSNVLEGIESQEEEEIENE